MNIEAIKDKLTLQYQEELFTKTFEVAHDQKMLTELREEKSHHEKKVEDLSEQLKNFPADDHTRETREKKKGMLREVGTIRKNLETYVALEDRLDASIRVGKHKINQLKDRIVFLKDYKYEEEVTA